ncbi:hypothetical protein NLI96_g6871 [Meripilus lineatus]|uniref:Wax synthase domain-containing protein n=1 Tax=Meripilus lineatus TaxID=2056292 RepID=A0AAD5YHS1_9APHY|nr:hypothetical protein NLI96_g6871 [Physisporinus lineatus]
MILSAGFLGLSAMVLGVDLALAKEGRLKIGESSVPTSSPRTPPLTLPDRLLPPWLLDTLEVSLTLRGIGWQFGRHVNVSKEYRPLERGPFLKATAVCFVQNYLVLDICLVSFKVLPGIGESTGGSLYYSGLHPLIRYPLALSLTLLSMVTLVSGMQTCYALATLFGVAILLQSPSQWPPIMDNPFAADSLHDFWSKRWHQALRRTFVVSGGIPGYWIGGQSGFVLGTFLASGLFHEGGTYLVGRGIDHNVTLYFVLQGVGLLLERYWRYITGRRVEGAFGRMWVRIFLIASSQIACTYVSILYILARAQGSVILVDSWFRRGLAGGTIIPSSLSLATRFILPALRELSGQFLFVDVY